METQFNLPRLKWQSLQHNGIAFPPEYRPRGITVGILGEQYLLNADQEELIYAWSRKKDTHYVQDKLFESNFIIDLRRVLPPKFRSISKISELDLSNAYRLVDEENRLKGEEKERFRNLPRDERRRISQSKKIEREQLRSVYGMATVDGV